MRFRLRVLGKLLRLLAYLVWREWVCGQASAVHPIEVLLLAVKVTTGADLSEVRG